MKKNNLFQIFSFLFLITQYGFSQVDVVYSNLVWSDEFNTNGPVDPNKWFHQLEKNRIVLSEKGIKKTEIECFFS